LLLVGSITAVAGPGLVPPATSGQSTVYRIWASLSDLRTGKVISKEMAWVRADGVDMTPTQFFRDSPAWAADRSMAVYLKTCAGTPGEPVDPAYLNGLKANSLAAEGIRDYESGRPMDAVLTLTAAEHLPGGDQVRVHNGLYMANLALGRVQAAEAEFGRMLEAGLDQGKLAVKFVFRPASIQFWPDRAISGAYPMWLRQIALHASERPSCLRVVGHTSPTGAPQINDVLSKRRADYVRTNLVRRAPQLQPRTEALGRGSSEPIVGTGRDDATDVLDRRVEFVPFNCLRAGASAALRDPSSRRVDREHPEPHARALGREGHKVSPAPNLTS
jgi:outer membrane protein OmpA-like peptidoglycan-associated protein